MPYSFTQIEEDKTRTIGFVFFFLLLFYFASFWLIALLVKNFVLYEYTSHRPGPFSSFNLRDSLLILAAALLAGYAHWICTTNNLVAKISGVLKAEPLNKADTYHQKFQNIIDEVRVATGGRRRIEGMVIPTSAMNAFALMDFEGRSVIGVTEGLLARLTRAQLEAVVGHEAAHIVAGDCLATTVTTSLFSLYSGLLKGLESVFRTTRSSSRRGGGILMLLIAVYVLLWITRGMSHLARMFISRQREYRADAVAMRLTRDPLSLAEALYAIAYRWRGAGLTAGELESIFIVNPAYCAVDEKTGLFADLFSTHPPLKERLHVLLEMAHTDMEKISKDVEHKSSRPRTPAPGIGPVTPGPQWMVQRNGAWEGPFEAARIPTLEGMRPETWVQRLGGTNIRMAYEDPELMNAMNNRNEKTGSWHCPKCDIPLTTVIYEGVETSQCHFCHGILASPNDVERIIIRQEVGFPEQITRLAARISEEEKIWREGVIKRDPKTMLTCPKCRPQNGKMLRMFYTAAYHVEIDKCLYCGSVWFDKDELEILQCLIEIQTNKETKT